MKKFSLIFFIIALGLQGCGVKERENAERLKQEREKLKKDSVESMQRAKIEREKAIKDSIAAIEQNIAIGDIKFGIKESEFKRKKNSFLNKCKLREFEFYKNATIFTYKLGEYGFSDLYGWFHKDSLYNIQFSGPIVEYDEYDLVMPEQYKALTEIMISKFGQPSNDIGLPKWTDLEKGYYRICTIWVIGDKNVEIRISCEGVKYKLNLEIYKPLVELKIKKEEEEKANKSTKKAVEII